MVCNCLRQNSKQDYVSHLIQYPEQIGFLIHICYNFWNLASIIIRKEVSYDRLRLEHV